MILVDSREGSSRYEKLLPDSILVTMDYGDVSFVGRGHNGKSINVGIEIKAIGDLINSMQTGRLTGHQLPGLLNEYDVVYVIVEGMWRANPVTGLLEVFRGSWRTWQHGHAIYARTVWNFITSLETLAGVRVRCTSSIAETASMITDLFTWWGQGLDSHKSIMQLHSIQGCTSFALNLTSPSDMVNFAAGIPGIRNTRAREVEKAFGTVPAMFAASERDWLKVDKIGKVTAKSAYEFLHGEGSWKEERRYGKKG